eukprot:362866-Chlamydomonas_euryale.AAC.6
MPPAAATAAEMAASAACCPSMLCTPWRPTTLISVLVTPLGSSPSFFSRASSLSAASVRLPRSHAASSALYTWMDGVPPSCRTRRSTASAPSVSPARLYAATSPHHA